jgi:subtilisin family serine protease
LKPYRRIVLLAVLAAGLTIAPAAMAGDTNGADDAARAVPGEVLVGFAPGTSDEQREEAVRKVSGRRKEKVARGSGHASVELIELPRGASNARAIEQLEGDPAVEYAEPNWILTTAATSNDPYFTGGSLWGMYGDASTPANQYGSQAAEAWAAEHTGSSQVYVGVIDEGIQFTHPDLDDNVWSNPFDTADGVDNDGNGYVDDIHGWDFAGRDNSVYDGGTQGRLDDHGTHVTGTIGGEGGNGIGVAGMSWDVTYISGKFLGRNGGTTANAIKAVDYITDLKTRHGLNVVATNNSWGGGGYSQALLDAIVRGAQANILFVAAAGNGGRDGAGDNNDSVASYPSTYNTTSAAGYDAVIAVAAITSSGSKAGFSNYGATTVELGAPGSGVYSTTAYNSYSSYSGTSMATPHVTGAAALFAAGNPGASADVIRGAILGSALPTASLTGKTVTGGRLNASGF